MAKKKGGVERLTDALYSRSAPPAVDPNARTPLSPEIPQAHTAPHINFGSIRGDVHAPEPVTQGAIETFERSTHMSPKQLRPKRSALSVLLIGSATFFFLAAAAAAYTFFGGGNTISPQNIDLDIVAPALIDAGKQVNLDFVIGNRNAAALKSADLLIDYPAGTRDATDPTQTLSHERLSIGDINSGKQIKQTAAALFFGQEGTQEQVHATLEYQLAGSNAVFTKETNTVFTIGSSPVSITIDSPAQAVSGQSFTMTLHVRSNATTPVEDTAVQAQYPFGFVLGSATPAPAAGNMWRLGELDPGASKDIQIQGTLTGQNGDARVFHFIAGSESDPNATQIAVPILSMPQQVTVEQPFISGVLTLNGQSGDTIPLPVGKPVNGTVTWTNNLGETISNVTLTLSLSGSSIDPSSVQAGQGFYDSGKNQIIWTSAQDASLAAVGPGQSGTYQFSFATFPPSAGHSSSNPQVKLNLSVHGSRQSQGNAPEDVSSAASVTAPLSSSVALTAQAQHFSGPFPTNGPVPPIAGQATTYSIVWTVTNSSNTIANGTVSATLPLNVDFVAAQQNGETVAYNSTSRTVTWTLGDVKAGAGYGGASRTAAFEVKLTPSVSQVGQAPQLTGAASFTGQDRFSQSAVTASTPAATTVLQGDSGFQYGMQTVSAH